MNPGKYGFLGKAVKGHIIGACLCLALLPGCAGSRQAIDRVLLAGRNVPSDHPETAASYRLGCPDVLDISIDGQDDWNHRQVLIGADGRIDLDRLGRLRVEGQTTEEAARTIAGSLAGLLSQIHVQVADYRSQKVYIFGEINGRERALPYRGQETVVELLQRAGGITPGAEPDHVHVIRGRVAEGDRPEVFTINLPAIVVNKDNKTNLLLQPGDQIYIGETRRSSLNKCIPPILRPFYEMVWSLYRAGQNTLWPSNEGNDPRPASAPLGRG
jgi:protein involved in polysaccharide export with SLBB domain